MNILHTIALKYSVWDTDPASLASLLAENKVQWVLIRNAHTLGGQGIEMIGDLARACSVIPPGQRTAVAFTATSYWTHVFGRPGAKGARFCSQDFVGNVNAQYLDCDDMREILTTTLSGQSVIQITDEHLEKVAEACHHRIADVIRIATAVEIGAKKQVTYGMLMNEVKLCGAGRGSPNSDVIERTFHSTSKVLK